MEKKIITSSSASGLNQKIADMQKEGWEPIGSHSVVVVHEQNRFAGTQHKDTIFEHEYSISVQREHTPSEGQQGVIDDYLSDLTEILQTKTDDLADLQNLRTATIQFLSVLKNKEEQIKL